MISDDVTLGEGVVITHPELVNLYGCRVGPETTIGPFVEVQRDVTIGARCKISSHSFICSGVSIEDGVFIGHGVMFTNDLDPSAVTSDGRLKGSHDWTLLSTLVRRNASVGSNATILAGLTIGEGALIGAGAVVTRDVAEGAVVKGNPARLSRTRA
jgi:acetyltransferase-like isoleucine patch superfamily enzyme